VVCTGVDTTFLEVELSPNVNTNSLTADVITAAGIADNAFANEHFANGALTSTEITSAGGCVVASIANDAITAASIATDAITDDAIATGAIASTAFANNSITNAAVADDVDVNVKTMTAGVITSTVLADDCITAAKLNTDAIAADAFAQTAADKVWGTAARVLTANTNLGGLEVDLTKIHGTALTETAGQLAAAFTKFFDVGTPVLTCESVNQAQDNATVAEIADAVWDEVVTTGAHDTATFAGAGLLAAASAGDPWSTALPGAYGAGTAGKALSDVLADTNELQTNQGDWATATGFSTHSAADVWAVATRTLTAIDEDATTLDLDATIAAAVWNAATSGYNTAGSYGAAVEDILSDTNELQADDTPTAVAAIKTVVDAVKLKTDNIPATPAAVGSVMTISSGAITAGVFAAGAINADVIANGAIDQATFAADVYVTCDVKKVNGTTLTGDGGATPWGPA
jgi:trimeric autotransporter adhesin